MLKKLFLIKSKGIIVVKGNDEIGGKSYGNGHEGYI